MTVAISLPSHSRTVTRRDLSARTVEVQLSVWSGARPTAMSSPSPPASIGTAGRDPHAACFDAMNSGAGRGFANPSPWSRIHSVLPLLGSRNQTVVK